MDGLALPFSDLPLHLIEQYRLERFLHERGGEKEIRFSRRVRHAILPIRHEGQLMIVPWGCKNGKLPQSGFTWLTTVEAGEWTVILNPSDRDTRDRGTSKWRLVPHSAGRQGTDR